MMRLSSGDGMASNDSPMCIIDDYPVPMDVLIGTSEVERAVTALDADLAEAYKEKMGKVLVIGVLNGALPLMGRLVTGRLAAVTQLQYDTVQFKSRTKGTAAPTGLQQLKDVRLPVAGKHVIVVEDLVDSGFTLSKYLQALLDMDAASVSVASLIDKPAAHTHQFPAKVIHRYAFQVDSTLWVTGFGMDIDEQLRWDNCIRAPRPQLVLVPKAQQYSFVL